MHGGWVAPVILGGLMNELLDMLEFIIRLHAANMARRVLKWAQTNPSAYFNIQ
jgi:hypothetical protein